MLLSLLIATSLPVAAASQEPIEAEAKPTIYVLDHEGRIRFKGVRGEAMDEAVDQLLAEMKAE